MKIKEEVDSVQVVGEVSNRTMKSINMIGIWSDREGMIKTIWENYKKKEIEQVLKSRNENEAIGWVETYTFFPCLDNLPSEDPESFFKEIEEPYNYHATFFLEHYSERSFIFYHHEYGLGTWDMVVARSLRTFAPYSKPALKLMEKFYDLERFLRAQDHMYAQAL